MSDTPLCDRCGAPTDDHVFNMAGCVDFLKRERDEARRELERAEAKCSAEYEAHKMTQAERDALRAEVAAWAELVHDVTGQNQSSPLFIKHEIERLEGVIDDMRAEVERLKAGGENYNGGVLVELAELREDKARLDWIEALDCDSPFWGVLCDTTKLRAEIDAAMKGGAL
jgi:chromosome segregation ATPase